MAARHVRKVPLPRLTEHSESFGTVRSLGNAPAEPTEGLGPPNVTWPEPGSGFEAGGYTPSGAVASVWSAVQWVLRSNRRRHRVRVVLLLYLVLIAAVALLAALLPAAH